MAGAGEEFRFAGRPDRAIFGGAGVEEKSPHHPAAPWVRGPHPPLQHRWEQWVVEGQDSERKPPESEEKTPPPTSLNFRRLVRGGTRKNRGLFRSDF